MSWRYIAQRIAGPSKGQFLDWNLPLGDVEITDSLGTNWLSAAIDPQIVFPMAADGRPLLDKWSVAIWAEENGLIRGGGILVENQFTGPKRQIDVMGYAGYPHGLPWTGEYAGINKDPMELALLCWAEVQGAHHPTGDLDLIVYPLNASPVRLGTPESNVAFQTAGGDDVAFNAGPYRLSWWEAPDIGSTLDTLMKDTPFQQRETHTWNADGSIRHLLEYQYPRMGKRRADLRFMLGENIALQPSVSDDGTYFANEILGLGAGTGRTITRASAAVVDNRLRRVFVLNDPSAKSTAALKAKSGIALAKHTGTLSISTVTVIDHPNASIGSWQCGDEILIQADLGWMKIAQWCKILSTTIKPESGNEAVLTLEGLTA